MNQSEPIGIVKIPRVYKSWSIYHRLYYEEITARTYTITQAEYETFEILELFPVFNHGGSSFFNTVFIYDPRYFEDCGGYVRRKLIPMRPSKCSL